MNVKLNIHEGNSNIEGRIKFLKTNWKVPDAVKKDVIDFVDQLSLGKVNLGKKGTERTQVKYVTLLKIPLEYFNKPISKFTNKDIEQFDKDLTSGKLRSNKEKEYTHNVKVEIRRAFKVFLRWKIGEKKTIELAGWLDTREKKKTPDYLTEQEIIKMYRACKNNSERYLIAVLFDSGARAEEFFNIRYEDITLPENNENFVKIALKEEYSKTLGRTISLYWKYTFEAVRDYLRERESEGIKSSDVVFNKTYDGVRIFLSRFGKKVLKKRIHFHLFRHSSATYYSTKMNRQELCYRYGWRFSSDMPDIYISRSGMENKQLDEKFTQTEMGELKSKLEKQEEQNKRLKESFEKELEERKKADQILNKLISNPKVRAMLEK